jgi:hypothetical protein
MSELGGRLGSSGQHDIRPVYPVIADIEATIGDGREGAITRTHVAQQSTRLTDLFAGVSYCEAVGMVK